MSEPPRHHPFVHEIAFLLIWLAQVIALVAERAFRPIDLLLPVLAAGMLLLMKKGRGGWLYHVRLWYPLLAFDACYLWMGNAIPRLRDWRADDVLLSLDRRAFGICLSARMAPWISSGVHEILATAYLSFFALYTLAYIAAGWRGGKLRAAILSGFYLIYAAGLAGYTLFPAAGPFRCPGLKASLPSLPPGGPITQLNDSIVLGGCNGVDVFPSLHTAVTVFLLLSAFSLSRRLFAILLIPCLLIITATIGLQYHYAADVLAGAVIGTSVWWSTVRRHYQNLPTPTP